jgi:hypothetical protein
MIGGTNNETLAREKALPAYLAEFEGYVALQIEPYHESMQTIQAVA